MSCGCGSVRNVDLVAAGMCATCRHARATDFTTCSINGMPLAARTKYKTIIAPANRYCPVGKQVDPDGTVRWLFLRWVGVPYPLRFLYWPPLHTFWNGPILSRPFAGCGCVYHAKRLWERLRRR